MGIYTGEKKQERILDLCLFFFFRLRAVIPLYLLVPSYLALRGNWQTPKTQGFSQKPWPGWLKKTTGVLRSIRWHNTHLQPGFVPSITVNVHGEAKLAQVYLLDVWCTANGFNCTCFGLFWIGRIKKNAPFSLSLVSPVFARVRTTSNVQWTCGHRVSCIQSDHPGKLAPSIISIHYMLGRPHPTTTPPAGYLSISKIPSLWYFEPYCFHLFLEEIL